MFSPLQIAGLLALTFTLVRTFRFIANVRHARRSGLRWVISPITEVETLAYFTDPLIRHLYNSRLLEGRGWPSWARFMVKDWMYEDRRRAHDLLGEVFIVVSPGAVVCYAADAGVALDACTRRRDFTKPRWKMSMLEPFGPNVVSTEGELWKVHYRITAPPFGDGANRLVWQETLRQVPRVIDAWAKPRGAVSLKSDVYMLGLTVISYAGFGRQLEWTEDAEPDPGHQLPLIQALLGVVLYLPFILVFPPWLLRRSPWKAAHVAFLEFRAYIREFVAAETAKIEEREGCGAPVVGNLLTALLKTNRSEERAQSIEKLGRRAALDDDEVMGNVFMYFMAGYDTTANTVMFACITLALRPEVQDKMLAEIDRNFAEAKAKGREELTFTDDFNKFRYTLAFLYETLRFFPVVVPITRICLEEQTISVESATSATGPKTTHVLPPNCGVVANNTGVHYNPRYWPSPEIISPERWLHADPNVYDPLAPPPPPPADAPQVPIPSHAKGTFLSFSEGHRACLGRKFAQSEFVCFFAHLLRNHRLVLQEGVSLEEVENRVKRTSAGSPVTLAPPFDVPLRLVAR